MILSREEKEGGGAGRTLLPDTTRLTTGKLGVGARGAVVTHKRIVGARKPPRGARGLTVVTQHNKLKHHTAWHN